MKDLKRILDIKKIGYIYNLQNLPYETPVIKERISIKFKNDLELSIIKGYGCYSSEKTYEIAIIENNKLTNKYFIDKSDTVIGYVKIGTIIKFINLFSQK